MAPKLAPSMPDGLTPLEAALVQTLQNIHQDVIKELRIFRWQTMALIVFLVVVVAMLKGVDPRVAGDATTQVLTGAPTSVPAAATAP